MWFIYILQHSVTKQKYIGISSNLERRLAEHNAGKTSSTRRNSGEWAIVYVEGYRDKQDAIMRELRLKNHASCKARIV